MEVEKERVTNKIDSVVESGSEEALHQLLRKHANFPDTLKDVLEYLGHLKYHCEWLRKAPQKPLESIWTECYLRKYPMEIPAIYEYHHFSQKPVGVDQFEKYGIIDLVLGINYSNIKGFTLSAGVKEFFLTEKGTVTKHLYSGSGIFLWNSMDRNEWRMFHFKMRMTAFHFLYWLSGMVTPKNKEVLIEYGDDLFLSQSQRSFATREEKIDFFLAALPLVDDVREENARAELEKILDELDLQYSSNDRDLFILTYNREEMKKWMSDDSPKMNNLFRERCLTSL